MWGTGRQMWETGNRKIRNSARGRWALFLQGRETVVGMEKEGTPCSRTKIAAPAQGRLLTVERGVLSDCVLLVFRYFFSREDGICRAGCNAGAAVHAILGIDVHLRFGFPLGLIRFRMDGVTGAGIDAELIFCAGISNYISHDCLISDIQNASTSAF